ncbi:MAG: T4 prohead core scaffold protein [Gammaproteobacteria bacterium]
MENVVTKGAAAADPMPKMADPGTQLGNVEDLGGPTPENYKPDDDSSKLKDAGAILAQVRDVVNKGAKPAEAMPKMANEEEEVEGDVVAEEEATEEEVVSEEETTVEEVVSEEEVAEETIDVEEDVNALLEGEELSEEFQEKARTIFEAAIRSKVAEVKEEIEKQYESALIEEVVAIKEQLTDRVDAYLEYVADEWMQENQLAIEHGLKTEMTESFLTGMKSLFEDHYVTIPEEKYDVLNSMVEKLDEMEDKLNEQINRNIALNQRLAESVADVIFSEVCEGLALSQKDKLASLAENVEFDSEENYREKLVTLRESYFPSESGTQRDKSDTISEETTETKESVSGLMETYLSTLNRVSKK